ncbi:prominin-1-like isoform X2 [Lytechinus variegatus]|uniref:prominin-1-like isoform X2 n=1 Tax=Lytechinus variegatus TaxID=7654 RepID=UPI001BB251F9|nr:prominin-1-like isoform X2 [Lytechinus variegatus]
MEKPNRTYLHVMCLGTLIACFAIHGTTAAGNVSVNINGTITYADLPEGRPYSSPAEFDEGSFPLPTTWDFIGNFLSSVSPGEPPYELINAIIGDPSSIDLSLLTGNITRYQRNLMGFAICFVLGLLFVLIFPIVALCFCCCRCCCKNCGGKMHMDQKDNSCCRVMIYSICLLASLVFVFSGAVTALCISGYTGSQATTLPTRVSDNILDFVRYLNNTLEEIDFVMTDQLSFTLDQVRTDLNDIGTLVGVPVRESLRTNVGPAIDAVIDMEENINGTLFYMEAIDTRQARMEINYEILSTNLTAILNDLTTLCGSCGCCSNATTQLRDVEIDADYRDINVTHSAQSIGSFPQVLVSQSIVELTDVANRNISDQAQEGYQTFEDIPDTLTNTTSSEVGDIISTIDGLEDTLNQFINETTFTLQSTSGSIEPFEEQANNILSTYANDYDQYRAIVMYVFYGFILFIVVLFLLGLLIGVFSYDRNASPTDRGSCSNCGGLFLMAGAGFVFIFGTFMMLITALTFIIGGPIDRLMCDPLVSGQLFAQTVDLEDGILDDGYYLGNLIFSDPSVPFQISGFLDACEQNEAVYTAFLLENLFNVTQFTDISSQIPDVDDQFSNITGDFSSVQILTSDTKDTLIDFRDSPADTIDWTIFTNELDTSLLYDGDGNNDTLVELINALGIDADAASGSDKTDLNAIKDDLQTLQDEIVDVLLNDAVLIAREIDSLTAYTDDIDVSIYSTLCACNPSCGEVTN